MREATFIVAVPLSPSGIVRLVGSVVIAKSPVAGGGGVTWGTMVVIVAVLVIVSLVAVMVMSYVPGVVSAGAVRVRVDVPCVVICVGLNDGDRLELVAVRSTVPVKPLFAVMVMVDVALLPASIVSEFGLAERVKSGCGGCGEKLVVIGVPIPVARSYPSVAG